MVYTQHDRPSNMIYISSQVEDCIETVSHSGKLIAVYSPQLGEQIKDDLLSRGIMGDKIVLGQSI